MKRSFTSPCAAGLLSLLWVTQAALGQAAAPVSPGAPDTPSAPGNPGSAAVVPPPPAGCPAPASPAPRCEPEPRKVCVPVPAKVQVPRIVYDCREVEFCLPRCPKGLCSHHKKKDCVQPVCHAGGCGQRDCGGDHGRLGKLFHGHHDQGFQCPPVPDCPGCDKPRCRRVLLKKVVIEECDSYKCELQHHMPCITPPASSCGAVGQPIPPPTVPGGQAAPSERTVPMMPPATGG